MFFLIMKVLFFLLQQCLCQSKKNKQKNSVVNIYSTVQVIAKKIWHWDCMTKINNGKTCEKASDSYNNSVQLDCFKTSWTSWPVRTEPWISWWKSDKLLFFNYKMLLASDNNNPKVSAFICEGLRVNFKHREPYASQCCRVASAILVKYEQSIWSDSFKCCIKRIKLRKT